MADNTAKIDSKEYLKKHAKAGTKIKLKERIKVEVIKETQFYKKGDILNPHSTWADELIAKGIAKKYEAPKK